MKLTTTDFDFNIHDSKEAGNEIYGFYTFHNVDAYNTISIDDVELLAVYQTGLTYEHNDYDCPTNTFKLSREGGSSKALLKIAELVDEDFENDSLIAEYVEKVQVLCSNINSVEKLKAIYDILKTNQPNLSSFVS